MPAPDDVIKPLTERPTPSLTQTWGCMRGLFHIFEGHPALMGRRYSSTRVGIDSARQSQLSTGGTDSQSRRYGNPYSKMEEDSFQIKPSTNAGRHQKTPQSKHHRSYSDISDLATTPSRTLTEFGTSQDRNVQIEQQPAGYSEGKVDPLAFYNSESLRAAAVFARDPRRRSDLDQREHSKHRSIVPPKATPKGSELVNTEPLQASSGFRDVVITSFHGESERPKGITKTSSHDPSLNMSLPNHGSLKNFQRPLDRSDERRKAAELPRSSSIFAKYEPRELVHWKDGLRSSASPPRKAMATREGDLHSFANDSTMSSRRFSRNTSIGSHPSSPERRKTARGRAELKMARRRSHSRDQYPFVSTSPRNYFPGSQDSILLTKAYEFKESPGASDFRESLRPFLAGAREPHSIVPCEAFASRSAESSLLDSRGTSLASSSESNQVGLPHQKFKQFPDGAGKNEHCTAPNVIARLMGLEDIPSSNPQYCSASSKVPDAKSRGDRFFQGLVQFDPHVQRPRSPPPPPPCQSKKYVDVHHLEPPSGYYRQGACYEYNYPGQYKMEQRLCCCEEERDYEHLQTRSLLAHELDQHQERTYPTQGSPPKLLDGIKAGDSNVAPEISPLLTKRSNHKKKTLWKILEAMRPKVLLKITRRKQTPEQEKSSPSMTKSVARDVQPMAELFEQQEQTDMLKVITESEFSSGAHDQESILCSSSVRQVQEEVIDSSDNTSESSVVKPTILQAEETKIVVMKPIGNMRSHCLNADTFQVRHVETASSTSNDNEMCPIRCTANDQRRAMTPVKSRVVVAKTPRIAHSGSTLESNCETDPSSTTQSNVSNNIREPKKTRTTTRTRSPSPRSPMPNTHTKQATYSSHEGRPLFAQNSPSRNYFGGPGEIGRKPVNTKSKKDNRATSPATPKAQTTKGDFTLKRRASGSSLEADLIPSNIGHPIAKESTFFTRPAGARSRSPAALRAKQANEGPASPVAPRLLDTPPRESDFNRPSIPDAATLDTSDSSNVALLQPADSAQLQNSDCKPAPEQRPKPGRFKEPHVYIRRLSTVQTIEDGCVGDHYVDTTKPSKSGACNAVLDDPQPLLQVQEETKEANQEVTPLRGIPLMCAELDDKLAQGLDRPSPVSVLDTTHFDEELTPSPNSPKHRDVVLVQDFVTTNNCEGQQFNEARHVEAYCETAGATIEGNLDFDEVLSKCSERLRVQNAITATEIRLNRFQSYFKDAEPDEERTFVESFLVAPQLQVVAASCRSHDKPCVSDEFKTSKQSSFALTDMENHINENLLQSLLSNGILQDNDHILLLDCLEEIMSRILDSQSNLGIYTGIAHDTICTKTKGKQLEQELWIELHDIKRTPPSEDICDTVHRLLQKDLIRCQEPLWSNYNTEREKIGTDMEGMIVADLIDEAIRDLCALQWRTPTESSLPVEATRRQLFAF